MDNIYTFFNISMYEKKHSQPPQRIIQLDKLTEVAKKQAEIKNEEVLQSLEQIHGQSAGKKETTQKNTGSTPTTEKIQSLLVSSKKMLTKVRSAIAIFVELELKMKKHNHKVQKKISKTILDTPGINPNPTWRFNTTLFWFADLKTFDHLAKKLQDYKSDQISVDQFEEEMAKMALSIMYSPIPTKESIFRDHPFGVFLSESKEIMGSDAFDYYSEFIVRHYTKHEMLFDKIVEDTLKQMGLSLKDIEKIKNEVLMKFEKGLPEVDSLDDLYALMGSKQPKNNMKQTEKDEFQEVLNKVKENMNLGRHE